MKTTANEIISYGKCICVYEPRGDYGLEGYQLGDEHPYQLKKSKDGKKYYKVFPITVKEMERKGMEDPIYGECCTSNQFKKCFNITTIK